MEEGWKKRRKGVRSEVEGRKKRKVGVGWGIKGRRVEEEEGGSWVRD